MRLPCGASADDYIAALNLATPFEIMRFTLTYAGPLPAAGNKSTRAKEKWAIRRVLHPQLAVLWQTHPVVTSVKVV
jgi:hypothetical protein